MLIVVFYTTEEFQRRILPKPLKPSSLPLAAAFIAEYPNTNLGPFWEAAIEVQAQYKDLVGIYCPFMYVSNDIALAVGREVWGYPRKIGTMKHVRRGNRITATLDRQNQRLMTIKVKLTDEGDWIDTGPNLNLKLIPSIDGTKYAVKQITATDVKFSIHKGLSGDAELILKGSKADPINIVPVEEIMTGLYFDLDIDVPLGKTLVNPRL